MKSKIKEIRNILEGTLFLQKYQNAKVVESTIRDIDSCVKKLKVLESQIEIAEMLGR